MSQCLSLALILASCRALAASVILSNAGFKISSRQASLPLLFKPSLSVYQKHKCFNLTFYFIPDLHFGTFPFTSENEHLLLCVDEKHSCVSFS